MNVNSTMSHAMPARNAWIMLEDTAVSVRLEKPETIVINVSSIHLLDKSLFREVEVINLHHFAILETQAH